MPDLEVKQVKVSDGSGTSLTLPKGQHFRLLAVYVHADASVSDDLTVALNAGADSAYDTQIYSVTAAFTDIAYVPNGSPVFNNQGSTADKITIACSNSGGATLGIQIICELL